MSSVQGKDDTDRIVAQRLRNNIMAQLAHLAESEAAVLPCGFGEYFEAFFMEVPYEGVLPNEAMTDDEVAALSAFLTKFREACDATPKRMADQVFLASGWPALLAPLAASALSVFSRRGVLDSEKVDPR